MTKRIYVGFNFGSYAYVGVELLEGLTLNECIKRRSEDIISWYDEAADTWHNI